jgi:hypothetical protein
MSDQTGGYEPPKLEGYKVDLLPETEKAAFGPAAMARHRIRITLHGENFIERAMIPIIKIGDIYIKEYNISPDGRTITGFLDEMPEEGSVISVSYGNQSAELSKGFSLKNSSEKAQPDYADETNSKS